MLFSSYNFSLLSSMLLCFFFVVTLSHDPFSQVLLSSSSMLHCGRRETDLHYAAASAEHFLGNKQQEYAPGRSFFILLRSRNRVGNLPAKWEIGGPIRHCSPRLLMIYWSARFRCEFENFIPILTRIAVSLLSSLQLTECRNCLKISEIITHAMIVGDCKWM